MNSGELIAITDAICDELVAMAPDAADVCPVCRSGKSATARTCWSCGNVMSQVRHPCKSVIPISYYRKPSKFRDIMHDYKESDDAETRYRESRVVGGILTRYLVENGEALVSHFGQWDVIVPVPSTKTSPPSALSSTLVTHFSEFLAPSEFLVRGSGTMSFNHASETGFESIEDIRGASVLLIDDTYTTGARLHSAAHALQSAGAFVVAGLVVARKIDPVPRYYSEELWLRQADIPFSFRDRPWWDS
jgi:predicted amidophosphoribosyltransferase